MTKHLDLDAIERAYRMTGNADTVTMRLIAELRMARPVVETAEALLATLDAATERAKKAEAALAELRAARPVVAAALSYHDLQHGRGGHGPEALHLACENYRKEFG